MTQQKIIWLWQDLLVMIERNLLRYVRLPQLIVFSSIQPVMFLLLFTYVFGGAIHTGGEYIAFLLPGILVQTVMFGAMASSIGVAEDLAKGLVDRFRSLPMARSAFLLGRTLTDMIRNVFVVLLMLAVGYLIGFRLHGSATDLLTAFALLLYFGFAFSWVSVTIGVAVKNIETAQVAGFIWVFPLVFASGVFVPVETMPTWLRTFAELNPVTLVVNSIRGLTVGGFTEPDLHRQIVFAFIWIIAILIVFIPLAVRLYRRAA